jgi:SAM-dependent methyltransferase
MDWENINIINEPIDFINLEDNSNILDIGFGNGNEIIYLSEKYNTYGIDIKTINSDKFIQINQDIRKVFPFQDNFFDVIYARLSLHYFTESELNSIFSEIKRVLKVNSYFKFSVKTNDGGFNSNKIFHSSEAWTKICSQNFEIININYLKGLLYGEEAEWVEYLIKS